MDDNSTRVSDDPVRTGDDGVRTCDDPVRRGDAGVWAAARASRAWLDAANGSGQQELTCRILKLTEEAGEAAGAWIGLLGQNPRKGVTHTREDVAAELADVAFTALVAVESLGLDARTVLDRCAAKVTNRISAAPEPTERARPS
ncbi:MazG-like family protein [Micromonospora sp. WMMD812]|uniref:MazG-like family protein n=1 Tax=Micromonospora sp. WMMD812 TaxID=3015152 RepID=UPI00248B18C0|nr:MazG-like family protein [Micromonospora sp. WMMD812]WBB68962.1 MazG-like family protein [Micromonospora sp. WMMD812]